MDEIVIGFKMFRQRPDGTLGPLFINRRQAIEINEFLPAEDHKTKGYAHRPGWHATLKPEAPHLKLDAKSGKRVWARVALRDITRYDRPESQGGTWLLAKELMVLEVL
jgi:hypothetical protein